MSRPGDLPVGLILLTHLAILAWAYTVSGSRASEILWGGPMGTVNTHAAVGLVYGVATVLLVWACAILRAQPARPSPWWGQLASHRNGMIGVGGVITLISIAVMTPWLAPFDPNDPHVLGAPLAAPGWVTHPTDHTVGYALLGTDSLGRDLFSRILYGSRISLVIGFVAIAIATTIGTLLGAVAGYFGRWVDASISWVIDLALAVPRLVLLLAIVGVFKGSDMTGETEFVLIVGVLGLTGWMSISRIVRGQVLALSQQDFIHAARALGFSSTQILLRHLIPNALGPVIVYASLGIGATLLIEASLSFLGLGISPPTPTWGGLVADGRKDLLNSPWLATWPGLMIVWAVLSFNLLGDGLRDLLDPRQRSE